MANKTIDGLDVIDTINNDDLVVLGDNSTGDTPGTDVTAKKTTIADLSAKIEADLSLGSAATTDSSAYATAAQGALASSAVQPGDNISDLTNDEDYISSDALTSSSGDGNVASGSVIDVIALTQDQYDNRTQDANDSKKLFVITDGKTKDSYVGQIDTLTADKTYTIDLSPVTDREILSISLSWTDGAGPAGTVDLKVNNTSVLDSGTPLSLATGNTASQTLSTVGDVTAGQAITLVASADVADITDFAFVVEYQS